LNIEYANDRKDQFYRNCPELSLINFGGNEISTWLTVFPKKILKKRIFLARLPHRRVMEGRG
jgi:hypothetical protein